MPLDQAGHPVVDLLPDLARHHRFERRGGDLEGEVAGAAMAGIDDRDLSLSAPGGGEGRGEVGDDRSFAEAHLTLPLSGSLPLPLKGRRGALMAGSN